MFCFAVLEEQGHLSRLLSSYVSMIQFVGAMEYWVALGGCVHSGSGVSVYMTDRIMFYALWLSTAALPLMVAALAAVGACYPSRHSKMFSNHKVADICNPSVLTFNNLSLVCNVYAIVQYTRIEVSLPTMSSKANKPEEAVRMNFVWKGVFFMLASVCIVQCKKKTKTKASRWYPCDLLYKSWVKCCCAYFWSFWICTSSQVLDMFCLQHYLRECCGLIAQAWWKTFEV